MLGQALFVVEAATVLALCLLVLGTVSRHLGLPRRVTQILVGAFTLRAVTAVVVDALGTFAGQFDFFDFDDALWLGAELLRDGVLTAPLEVAATYGGNDMYIPYTALYSPVYAVFGHHTLLARFVFALIGTLFVLNVYRLTDELAGRRAGLYAAGIAGVFPYWLYLSAIFYRDMLVMLVLSQVLYALLRLQRSRSGWALGNAVAFTIVSFLLRPVNVLPLGIAFLATGYALVQTWHPAVKGAILTALSTVVAWVFTLKGIRGNSITVSAIASERDFVTRGSGAYLETVLYSNWFELASFIPLGMTYLLFVPFPWQVHNELALIALGQNLVVWYPVVVLAILGLPWIATERPYATLALVGFAASGIAGYGLIDGNMGPALRHRSQFQIVFVAFAAIGISKRCRAITPDLSGTSSKLQAGEE